MRVTHLGAHQSEVDVRTLDVKDFRVVGRALDQGGIARGFMLAPTFIERDPNHN